MRELKELLSEGERVYELTRCASSSVYFIGPETDDIDHMDVSGALEDTLHRMVDAGFTEEEIAEHLCAYQDSDAMDDDDCYYIDLDYVIYDFYPMSILDIGIHTKRHSILILYIFLAQLSAKTLLLRMTQQMTKSLKPCRKSLESILKNLSPMMSEATER